MSGDSALLARSLFNPGSVALVGASGDETRHAGLAQRYLRRHGYQGRLYLVNPKHSQIHGERVCAHVGDIRQPVDHAFIMLPTRAVMDAVVACCQAGVRCATILSNGFAESGEQGRAQQARLVDAARESGMRILGPNSLGMVNVVDRIALSVSEVLSLPDLLPGRFGVISQSGGMMGALLSHGQAQGIGFSKLISTGNESDLTLGEIGDMLVDDDHTDAILLFLETIREPDRVAAMARRAYAAGKPVVAFCLGRSALGAQLAAAHTGAISGSGAAMTAFLRDVGIVRVDMLETLLHIAPMLIYREPPRGRSVSVMTTTGGGGGMVVDCLGAHDVEIAPPGVEVAQSLREKGISIGESPLIDLTLSGTNARTYGTVLTELLGSARHDAVVAVVGASAQFRPDRAVEPIVDAAAQARSKALAVFLTPPAQESFDRLRQSGIAAFRSPETCADAVRAYLDWQVPRVLTDDGFDTAALVDALSTAGPGLLEGGAASHLVGALGIAQPATLVLPPTPSSWSDEQLAGLCFPSVAKIMAPGIAHKTEVGGVVLGITSAAALRDAGQRMLADVAQRRPAERVDGIEVQSMERGLIEVLIGYRRDLHVGPTITLGIGGVLTELYRDFVTRLAPVDEATAQAMITQVRGLAAIRGYRDLPRGDLPALARAIQALSLLALVTDPPVLEAEINPLIVRREGEGVVAVDAVVVRA